MLLERAEAQRILAELLVRLAEPCRSTVLLRYHEGLSAVAIARAQGVPAGTVRWRLKEGLARLRAGMDARYRQDRRAWLVVFGPRLTGGVIAMASKTKLGAVAALVLLLVSSGALVFRMTGDRTAATPQERSPVTEARR